MTLYRYTIFVILQNHFGKIWQIGFGKITVIKRIKITKIVQKSGLFLYFAASINRKVFARIIQDDCILQATENYELYFACVALSIIYSINTYFLNSSLFVCVQSVLMFFVKFVQVNFVSLHLCSFTDLVWNYMTDLILKNYSRYYADKRKV